MKKRTTITVIIVCLFIISNSFAQIKSVNVGASIGLGEIKGNSPSVTSLGTSIYLDFLPWFSNDLTFRTGFI